VKPELFALMGGIVTLADLFRALQERYGWYVWQLTILDDTDASEVIVSMRLPFFTLGLYNRRLRKDVEVFMKEHCASYIKPKVVVGVFAPNLGKQKLTGGQHYIGEVIP
jgi:hypothetical protein